MQLHEHFVTIIVQIAMIINTKAVTRFLTLKFYFPFHPVVTKIQRKLFSRLRHKIKRLIAHVERIKPMWPFLENYSDRVDRGSAAETVDSGLTPDRVKPNTVKIDIDNFPA